MATRNEASDHSPQHSRLHAVLTLLLIELTDVARRNEASDHSPHHSWLHVVITLLHIELTDVATKNEASDYSPHHSWLHEISSLGRPAVLDFGNAHHRAVVMVRVCTLETKALIVQSHLLEVRIAGFLAISPARPHPGVSAAHTSTPSVVIHWTCSCHPPQCNTSAWFSMMGTAIIETANEGSRAKTSDDIEGPICWKMNELSLPKAVCLEQQIYGNFDKTNHCTD